MPRPAGMDVTVFDLSCKIAVNLPFNQQADERSRPRPSDGTRTSVSASRPRLVSSALASWRDGLRMACRGTRGGFVDLARCGAGGQVGRDVYGELEDDWLTGDTQRNH